MFLIENNKEFPLVAAKINEKNVQECLPNML